MSTTPPDGFRILEQGDGTLIMEYRASGIGCIGIFLCVWLTLWTVGWTWAYLLPTERWSEGSPPPLLFFLIAVAGAIFWGRELAKILWGRTRVCLGKEELVVEERLVFEKKRRTCERHRIMAVRQTKDGGDTQDNGYGYITTGNDDSFPTWGLFIESDTDLVVLSRQPIECSAWLGHVISDWCCKPYHESTLGRSEAGHADG
jgi:hypothetical protein